MCRCRYEIEQRDDGLWQVRLFEDEDVETGRGIFPDWTEAYEWGEAWLDSRQDDEDDATPGPAG